MKIHIVEILEKKELAEAIRIAFLLNDDEEIKQEHITKFTGAALVSFSKFIKKNMGGRND